MKIQAFNILAGSTACNARCPFCVSRMTPKLGLNHKEPKVNWRNFMKAAMLSKLSDVTTVKFTGKGEPTIFPEQITKYLEELARFEFPFIELQTNGILLGQNKKRFEPHLKEWYDLGLTTISISIVSVDPEKNKQIFIPHCKQYINLKSLISGLHDIGFSVRLACTMLDKFTCDVKSVKTLIEFAKKNDVEQLTLIPVSKPNNAYDKEANTWVEKHCLKPKQKDKIDAYLKSNGHRLVNLMHGAVIYDVNGQNVCRADCLTESKDYDELRQLIFFPDGHIRYDWQYEGAVLL